MKNVFKILWRILLMAICFNIGLYTFNGLAHVSFYAKWLSIPYLNIVAYAILGFAGAYVAVAVYFFSRNK
jgi:hypothetical protein